ncbi:putative transcription elongation factor 1 [Helianthus annuus]|nr:putative transcription elongation factor 1 [Helianthus annuus]
MGKRKSRAKPPPKKRMDKLDTVFSCPFCNHGTSVECHMYVFIYYLVYFSFFGVLVRS